MWNGSTSSLTWIVSKTVSPLINVIIHLHKKTNVFRGAFKPDVAAVNRFRCSYLRIIHSFSSSAQFTRLQVNRFSADVEIKGCTVRRLPDAPVAPFAHLLHTVQDKVNLGNMTSKWGRQRPQTILCASVRSSGYAKLTGQRIQYVQLLF